MLSESIAKLVQYGLSLQYLSKQPHRLPLLLGFSPHEMRNS